MTQHTINQPVTILTMGFKKNLAAYPREMEYQGKTYHFIDAGIRCVVGTGGRLSQILTLTDGQRHFRLSSDMRGGIWTLLSMSV